MTTRLTPDQLRAYAIQGDADLRDRTVELFDERRRDKCGGRRCLEGPCSCWEWAKERALN